MYADVQGARRYSSTAPRQSVDTDSGREGQLGVIIAGQKSVLTPESGLATIPYACSVSVAEMMY